MAHGIESCAVRHVLQLTMNAGTVLHIADPAFGRQSEFFGGKVIEPKGQTALDKASLTAGARAPLESDTAAQPPKSGSNDVGAALRNAFRATVDEDIPAEMLDLLRRLD